MDHMIVFLQQTIPSTCGDTQPFQISNYLDHSGFLTWKTKNTAVMYLQERLNPSSWKNKLTDRLHSSLVMAKGLKANIVSKAKNDITVEENEHDKKEGLIYPIDLIIKNC